MTCRPRLYFAFIVSTISTIEAVIEATLVGVLIYQLWIQFNKTTLSYFAHVFIYVVLLNSQQENDICQVLFLQWSNSCTSSTSQIGSFVIYTCQFVVTVAAQKYMVDWVKGYIGGTTRYDNTLTQYMAEKSALLLHISASAFMASEAHHHVIYERMQY
jgi:hypothetical protein